ncbi:MAG: sensor domain-containing diguanylate cyclase [Thermoguttaceae bacterium]|jgi:diguanylate cyclase (GGDEF)-like protein/PAS domain S-box-containing protein
MSIKTIIPPIYSEFSPPVKTIPNFRRQRRLGKCLQSFRLVMDLLPDAIFLIGCNSKKIIDANQAACSLLGYSKQELAGSDSTGIMPNVPWTILKTRSGYNQDDLASPVVICTILRGKGGCETPIQWTGMIVPAKTEPLWIVIALQVPLGDSGKQLFIGAEDCRIITLGSLKSNEETVPTGVWNLCNAGDWASLSLTPPGHDSLTGLPDRRFFFIRLERAFKRALRQEHYAFAVLFIDLDRFKNVNDSFGHLAGDRLLCKVAWRLVECIRPGDMVARHGGDEFTVFIDRLQDKSTALNVARRISNRLKTPVTFEGRELSLAGSIGIAFSWQNYTRPEDILNDADRAMYRAKAKGNSSYEIVYGHDVNSPHKPH